MKKKNTSKAGKKAGPSKAVGVFVAVIVVTVTIFLVRINIRDFEDAIVRQTQRHLLNTAELQGKSIKALVAELQNALKSLAENPNIKTALINNASEEDMLKIYKHSPMQAQYKNLTDKVSAFYRIDANGIIQSRIPWKKNRRGISYAHKPGVAYVIENRKPYVSGIFSSTSGQRMISLCQPVFSEQEFIGIVRTSLYLDTVENRITDLRFGEHAYHWIIDSDGSIVNHPNKELIGQSILQLAKKQDQGGAKDKLKVVNQILAGTRGTGRLSWDQFADEEAVLAWTPVRIGNRTWLVGVSMNYRLITDPIKAYTARTVVAAVLFVATFLAAGAVFYKNHKKQAQLQAAAESAQELSLINRQLQTEIAERKHTEEQLSNASSNWRESFDSINDAITIHDKNFTITRANKAAEQLLGLPLDRILGQKCYDIYHGLTCPPEGCPGCDVMNTGKACVFEVFEPNLDKFIEIKATPRFDKHKNVVGIIHVVQDISERKKAEEEKKQLQDQLRQTQKIQAVGTLAGGIAHDFNNILAAIVGYADLALQDTPKGTIARSNLEQVLIAGSRAKNLVKQILTFSRKTEQKQEPMEIAPIVKEALKMLRASIPTSIKIHQNIEATPSMIMADPTQIHQVLMNLCTNALHAMDGNSGILEVSLADFDTESAVVTDYGTLQPGSYVRLTIDDTGCGMDGEVAERIFEPFFTTKPVDKGTGMGLSVVHGIVENHGGIITVESELGKGSIFDIYFPRIENSDIHQNQSVQIPRGKGETILVVDDEKAVVDMMTQMLERLGYTVVGKTDSVEALETFSAEPDSFDLVITDYAMPNMTGKELAQALIAVKPDIPVILCTGFSENIDAERAKSMGVKEFIMKPVVKSEIAATIRNVLDKKEVTV